MSCHFMRLHTNVFLNFNIIGECPLNQPQKASDYVPDQEDARDVECHTCKKTGHFSRNCPDKFSGMSCYNCGNKGHLSSKEMFEMNESRSTTNLENANPEFSQFSYASD